jgi:hypothetical protein
MAGESRGTERRLASHAAKLLLAITLLIGVQAPALAEPEERPGGAAMMADLLVARPLGIVFTVVGTAAFVVSLPFSAAGGNVGEAAEKLVLNPARETFVRCLGCTTQHR